MGATLIENKEKRATTQHRHIMNSGNQPLNLHFQHQQRVENEGEREYPVPDSL